MNGYFSSGVRKFNHHWQSGRGNFAPLSPWYPVMAITGGIRYSVVLSGFFIDFPVVYKMPAPGSTQNYPIIGIMTRSGNVNPPAKCRLGIRQTDKPFSKVIITIKEKKNRTGVDWYIGENFYCVWREDGTDAEGDDNLKAASIAASKKTTWYSESPIPDKAGNLSTLGCIQQSVYKLKDGIEITFENTSGKWKLFELENFECYYVWDPYISSDKEQYESEEAAAFAKIYSDATQDGVFNTAILNNMWRWQVSIKAE